MRSWCVIEAVLLRYVLCITLNEIIKEKELCEDENAPFRRQQEREAPVALALQCLHLDAVRHCGFSVENSEAYVLKMSVCHFLRPILLSSPFI